MWDKKCVVKSVINAAMVTKDLERHLQAITRELSTDSLQKEHYTYTLNRKCNVMWLVFRPTNTHAKSHYITYLGNVTYNVQHTNKSHYITSHDNVIQCDLYHVQPLHSHVTIHHMTVWCKVSCILSNSYTVTLHCIACLNNVSSPTTSTDLTFRWELFY